MNIAIICPCLSNGGAERTAGLLSKKMSKYVKKNDTRKKRAAHIADREPADCS